MQALSKEGAASGASYGLDDLVCLLCLSRHAEVESRPVMPPPPEPVSVEDDLGLPLQGLQKTQKRQRPCRRRLVQKTGACSAAAIAGMLLLPWLGVRSAAAVDGCCHATRFFIFRQWGEARKNIADSVALHLSWESTAVKTC